MLSRFTTDPVFRFHVGRRVHALGGEAHDVVQHHHLFGSVIAGAANRCFLHRLMAIAERHADLACRGVPFAVGKCR